MSPRLKIVAALAAVAVVGCQFPADPDGTLERVRGGGTPLRVGVSEHDPWVRLDGGEPGGIEPELVRRFAATIDARIEWTWVLKYGRVNATSFFQGSLAWTCATTSKG
jgi:hypothetical protein